MQDKTGTSKLGRRSASYLPPLSAALQVESPGGLPFSSPFRQKRHQMPFLVTIMRETRSKHIIKAESGSVI